jgi:hypothetical protein
MQHKIPQDTFWRLSGNDFTPVKKPYFTGLLPIVYAFWQQNGNII